MRHTEPEKTMEHQPLDIEVVTHVTGSMIHCQHCQVFVDRAGVGGRVHQENLQSYPEEFTRDWERVSGWVLDLAATFPGQLVIRITDAQSLRGLWKSLTRGVRRYPTFIVGGRETYHGWDREHLNGMIRQHLSAAEG
jgi:hypothetical protein